MTDLQTSAPRYQTGFGNEFATEAVPGALPQGRNSPQRAPLDLYPELISGTAFTAPRAENRRSWLYRREPSVVAGAYRPFDLGGWRTGASGGAALPPEPLRWRSMPTRRPSRRGAPRRPSSRHCASSMSAWPCQAATPR